MLNNDFIAHRSVSGIAAVNVESQVRSAWIGRNLRDVVAVGEDRGRTTSSVVLVAVEAPWSESHIEYASFIVDHASWTISGGHYYGADGIADAWNLFALRTLPLRLEQAVTDWVTMLDIRRA